MPIFGQGIDKPKKIMQFPGARDGLGGLPPLDPKRQGQQTMGAGSRNQKERMVGTRPLEENSGPLIKSQASRGKPVK